MLNYASFLRIYQVSVTERINFRRVARACISIVFLYRNFGSTLENMHVAKPNQLICGKIGLAPTGKQLMGTASALVYLFDSNDPVEFFQFNS